MLSARRSTLLGSRPQLRIARRSRSVKLTLGRVLANNSVADTIDTCRHTADREHIVRAKAETMQSKFVPGAVDYEGTMSRDFNAGRALSLDSLIVWRDAFEP